MKEISFSCFAVAKVADVRVDNMELGRTSVGTDSDVSFDYTVCRRGRGLHTICENSGSSFLDLKYLAIVSKEIKGFGVEHVNRCSRNL